MVRINGGIVQYLGGFFLFYWWSEGAPPGISEFFVTHRFSRILSRKNGDMANTKTSQAFHVEPQTTGEGIRTGIFMVVHVIKFLTYRRKYGMINYKLIKFHN